MGCITEKPGKGLPAGSYFRDLIEDNLIYIDKTDLIHKLIKEQRYVFLSRPPRFGKTLFLNTLRHIFQGGPSNEALFKDTHIKKTFNYKFPEYTVLVFDFSRLEGKTLQLFNKTLRSAVGESLIVNGINENGCDENTGLKECTGKIFTTLHLKTGRRNVLLIDEYDHAWRHFRGNKEDQEEMLNVMQEFFTTLKSITLEIKYCFVTGSTKIALAEFFSGFNCAFDISWLPEYETIVGFSQILN